MTVSLCSSHSCLFHGTSTIAGCAGCTEPGTDVPPWITAYLRWDSIPVQGVTLSVGWLGCECLLVWLKLCWRPSWYLTTWAGYWLQTASQDGNWMLWKPLIFTSPWQLWANLQLTLKMNPAWKDSASTQPIVDTTFPSCTIPRRIKDPGRFFCPKQSHVRHSAGLKFCLPALVLSETQLKSTLTLPQSRASLKKLTAVCVVTPGVKCLQTVRAVQGWTHPVSQLEKPVMNHQGLMNAVLRIMHGCKRQHPNSPPEMSWLLSISHSCL